MEDTFFKILSEKIGDREPVPVAKSNLEHTCKFIYTEYSEYHIYSVKQKHYSALGSGKLFGDEHWDYCNQTYYKAGREIDQCN